MASPSRTPSAETSLPVPQGPNANDHPGPLQKMNSPLRQSCTASHWLHFTARSAGVKLGADEKFRAEKIPPEEAMIQAGRLRLRPIMVTALAAVASMLPRAVALATGSHQNPSIICWFGTASGRITAKPESEIGRGEPEVRLDEVMQLSDLLS
jgi:hypothetical protein